jgi:hypothetical protein
MIPEAKSLCHLSSRRPLKTGFQFSLHCRPDVYCCDQRSTFQTVFSAEIQVNIHLEKSTTNFGDLTSPEHAFRKHSLGLRSLRTASAPLCRITSKFQFVFHR